MAAEGAAIIDVGGESTRPGAAPVSVDGGAAPRHAGGRAPCASAPRPSSRSIPASREVMRAGGRCRRRPDQRRARAARAGGARGRGAQRLRGLPDAHAGRAAHHAAGAQLRRCASPRCARSSPQRVHACLRGGHRRRAAAASIRGSASARLCEHNLTLLRGLRRARAGSSVPLLVGLSRKSLLGKLTGRAARRAALRQHRAGAVMRC